MFGEEETNATTRSNGAPVKLETSSINKQKSLPSKQRKFIQIIKTSRDSFDSSANEILKKEANHKRLGALKNALGGFIVREWVGIVTEIDVTSEGDVIFQLELPEGDIVLGTWNNAFSDIFHGTIIAKKNALYGEIKEMNEGEKVIFSGNFIQDSTGFFQEMSLTLQGSMQAPEFLFKFSKIEKTN